MHIAHLALILAHATCATAICAQPAQVEPEPSKTATHLHIARCPQPMALAITLESRIERRRFPGYLCGEESGDVQSESLVAIPGADDIVDGSYRQTAQGLSISLQVHRYLPDDAQATWSFSGSGLAPDGSLHALKGKPAGSDLAVSIALRPVVDPIFSVDAQHASSLAVARALAAASGLRISGLDQAQACDAPITVRASYISAETIVDLLADVGDCRFQHLADGGYQVQVPRDREAANALIAAAAKATEAALEATADDDPAWAALIEQLETIRTLSRPRSESDVPPAGWHQLSRLAQLYQQRGAHVQRVAVLRDLLADMQRHDHRPDSAIAANARAQLGAALIDAGQTTEGKRELTQAAPNLDLTALSLPEAQELLAAYADLEMTALTSAQLRKLLLALEASPEVDNAGVAQRTFMAAWDGHDGVRAVDQVAPVLDVYAQWLADGVGNERLDEYLVLVGGEAFFAHDFERAAQLFGMEVALRSKARLRPDASELRIHHFRVASLLMRGEYAQAYPAMSTLVELGLALGLPETAVEGALLRDLRLVYVAASEVAPAALPVQALTERRSMPTLDGELQTLLERSVFATVRASVDDALKAEESPSAHIELLEAKAIALLAAQQADDAKVSMAAALSLRKKAKGPAGANKTIAAREAWFARLKTIAMAPEKARHSKLN